jgi:hypothetical protein
MTEEFYFILFIKKTAPAQVTLALSSAWRAQSTLAKSSATWRGRQLLMYAGQESMAPICRYSQLLCFCTDRYRQL